MPAAGSPAAVVLVNDHDLTRGTTITAEAPHRRQRDRGGDGNEHDGGEAVHAGYPSKPRAAQRCDIAAPLRLEASKPRDGTPSRGRRRAWCRGCRSRPSPARRGRAREGDLRHGLPRRRMVRSRSGELGTNRAERGSPPRHARRSASVRGMLEALMAVVEATLGHGEEARDLLERAAVLASSPAHRFGLELWRIHVGLSLAPAAGAAREELRAMLRLADVARLAVGRGGSHPRARAPPLACRPGSTREQPDPSHRRGRELGRAARRRAHRVRQPSGDAAPALRARDGARSGASCAAVRRSAGRGLLARRAPPS